MTKREKKVVWIVTLPNGRKQEIDESVAQKYFLGDTSATPFSHLTISKTVKLRPVTTSRAITSSARRPSHRLAPSKMGSAHKGRKSSRGRVQQVRASRSNRRRLRVLAA